MPQLICSTASYLQPRLMAVLCAASASPSPLGLVWTPPCWPRSLPACVLSSPSSRTSHSPMPTRALGHAKCWLVALSTGVMVLEGRDGFEEK
jgi:hypothetical protein